MDNKDLLKLLTPDMTEHEQQKALYDLGYTQYVHKFTDYYGDGDCYVWMAGGSKCSLADLAFRLRDDAKYIHRTSFVRAVKMIYAHCGDGKKTSRENIWSWFSREAKPIHWVIASLIAIRSN